MSRFTRGPCKGCLVFFFLVVAAAGCGQKIPATSSAAQETATQQVSATPCEIQLSDAKVTLLEPTLVQFEFKYRFTQGNPDKYYACDIFFTGTSNHAVKMMESWELNMEGAIKDAVVLSKPPVKSFEIQMSESPSPRERYKKISNVLSGPVK